jgi:hypothetical protein
MRDINIKILILILILILSILIISVKNKTDNILSLIPYTPEIDKYSIYMELNIQRLNKNTIYMPINSKDNILFFKMKNNININDENPHIGNMKGYVNGKYYVSNNAELKVRGAYSRSYPKKSYRLKFDDDIRFFNKKETKTYSLTANFLDPTQSKNFIMYQLSNQYLDFKVDTELLDIYINDKYYGVYELTTLIKFTKKEKDFVGKFSYKYSRPNFKNKEVEYNIGTKNTVLKLVNDLGKDNTETLNKATERINNFEGEVNSNIIKIDNDSWAKYMITCDIQYHKDSMISNGNNTIFSYKKDSENLIINPWDYDGIPIDKTNLNMKILNVDFPALDKLRPGLYDLLRKIIYTDDFMEYLKNKWLELRDYFNENNINNLREYIKRHRIKKITNDLLVWKGTSQYGLKSEAQLINDIDAFLNNFKFRIILINTFLLN